MPWTRVVKAGKTTYRDETVDLIEFIKENREKLVLRPNDEYTDLHSFVGYEHDDGSWARAIREAQRAPYVVQERVKPTRTVFPLMTYGHLEFKEMQVDVQPQAFLGKVAGCSSYVSSVAPAPIRPLPASRRPSSSILKSSSRSRPDRYGALASRNSARYSPCNGAFAAREPADSGGCQALSPQSVDRIWSQPHGMTSAGFHAKHLAGSTQRLCSYLAGAALTPADWLLFRWKAAAVNQAMS